MPSTEIEKYLEEMKTANVSQDKDFKKWIGKYCSNVIEKFVNTDRKAMAYDGIFPETMKSTYLTEAAYQQIKELKYMSIIEDSFHEINKERIALNVLILPTSSSTYGFAASDNLIIIYLNPNKNNPHEKEKVKWICAHEYAHLMDFKVKLENEEPLYPKTLYQDMIFEGKAVCYANEIVGDFGEAYISKGTPRLNFTKYKPIMHDTSYEITGFQEITVGGLVIHRTDVYIYGANIVNEYIKQNNFKHYEEWFYKEITIDL